jgi:hypothetical protein
MLRGDNQKLRDSSKLQAPERYDPSPEEPARSEGSSRKKRMRKKRKAEKSKQVTSSSDEESDSDKEEGWREKEREYRAQIRALSKRVTQLERPASSSDLAPITNPTVPAGGMCTCSLLAHLPHSLCAGSLSSKPDTAQSLTQQPTPVYSQTELALTQQAILGVVSNIRQQRDDALRKAYDNEVDQTISDLFRPKSKRSDKESCMWLLTSVVEAC